MPTRCHFGPGRETAAFSVRKPDASQREHAGPDHSKTGYMAKGRGRIEPNFDVPEGRVRDRGELDLRLSREDRPGTGDRVAKRGGGAAQRPAKATGRTKGGGAGRSKASGSGRRRRSWLGRLIYGTVVLGLWAVIGLAGLIAYHASQLPPIDQLAVPKRPPNIAILASDGSLLANRGETGGRGGLDQGAAALSAAGLRGDRGSPLLSAFRRRSGRHPARRSART